MNKSTIKILKNESGQVLLFAVVAMSIALAIGVAVSSRTLSNLSRTSRTDTSSRVYAAAEGGIESYLNLSDTRLGQLADALDLDDLQDECPDDFVGGTGSELDGCRVLYEFPGENIKAQAIVSVQRYKFNSSNNFLTFDLPNNITKEVYIENYSNQLQVCWNDTTSNGGGRRPDLYIMYYNSVGILRKSLIVYEAGANGAYRTNNATGVEVINSSSGGALGYDRCQIVTPPAGSYGMRVKAMYDNAKVGVRPSVPANYASFPNQGFQIISKGELQQEDLTKSVRTVKVFKSLPYLPGVFDNAIYSEAPITD